MLLTIIPYPSSPICELLIESNDELISSNTFLVKLSTIMMISISLIPSIPIEYINDPTIVAEITQSILETDFSI